MTDTTPYIDYVLGNIGDDSSGKDFLVHINEEFVVPERTEGDECDRCGAVVYPSRWKRHVDWHRDIHFAMCLGAAILQLAVGVNPEPPT